MSERETDDTRWLSVRRKMGLHRMRLIDHIVVEAVV